MKKHIYTLAAAVTTACAFSACEDMDTEPNGGWVTEQQKSEVYANDPSKQQAAVDGAFMKFNTLMPNEASLGSAHNDFGYPSIMLFTDAEGEDMVSVVNGYNWFTHQVRFSDRTISSYIQQMVWQDFYSYVNGANAIIASIDKESDEPKALFNLAQGYALRAFIYFQMAQMYQFNYVGNEDKPCVPILTDENADDYAINGGVRATVKEVYDLIYSDIDKAIELLSKTEAVRGGKYLVDLATAYGIRARVNLVTRNWAAAAADATAAIDQGTARPASIDDVSTPSFSDINESNWMWGIDISETDDVVNSGIVNWPSHMGSFSYGYSNYSGGFQISQKLFNSIADTDVRKGWWLNQDGAAIHMQGDVAVDHITDEYQKGILEFFECNIGEYYDPLTQVKFAPYKNEVGTSTNANDIPLMRIEEMYLIKAEGELMSGGNGLATLNSFVSTYRDPNYNYTGSDVHEEIWRQRRIELWGEGMSWFDIMRLNTGIDRRNTGFAANYTFKFDANDPILLWQIPETEVEANKALSTADYNTLAPTPNPVKQTGEELVSDEKINI